MIAGAARLKESVDKTEMGRVGSEKRKIARHILERPRIGN